MIPKCFLSREKGNPTVCAPDGKPTGFYEIEDKKNVNNRRMKVGPHPLAFYEEELQVKYNTTWSEGSKNK